MSRLLYADVVGTLGGSGLSAVATTHTFANPLTYAHGVTVPTLTGSDYFMLTILAHTGRLAEVVKVTAYNAGTGAATLVRGQEGTAGIGHAPGRPVTSAVYPSDVAGVLALGVTSDGVPLAGAGIDPTGATDSTAAVQALVDAATVYGAGVYVPGGHVVKMTDTLTVSDRITLRGPGELRWTAGIAAKPAILVTAEGAVVENLTMTNPNSLGNQSGAANYGIQVEASNFRATGNTVDGFQHGITVRATGEWANIVIHGNRVKDVLGAGDGPSSGSANGEDRGDGITVWGCQASIVGNVVNALAGTDARIGIHVEGLPGSAGAETPPHPNAMVTIGGNVVYGQFRRGIVTEDVKDVAISGNSVADATWWGIGAVSATATASALTRNVAITGNVVNWTRTASDDQGSSYSPTRCPLIVYGGVVGAAVVGNTVEVAATGEAEAFIATVGPSGTVYPKECVIANNVGRVVSGGAVNIGVRLDNYSIRAKIANNVLDGFTGHGVYGWSAYRCSIDGNDLHGSGGGSTKGVTLENDSTAEPVSISGNKISGCPSVGVTRMFGQGTLANNNIIEGATTGFEWYAATNGKAVGNLIIGATTPHASRDASILITD